MNEQEQPNIPPVETPSESVEIKKEHSLTPFVLTIVVLILIAGGVWFYINRSFPIVEFTKDNVSQKDGFRTPRELGFVISIPEGWSQKNLIPNEQNLEHKFKYESEDNEKSFVISIFENINLEETTIAQWSKTDTEKVSSDFKEDLFKVGVVGVLTNSYIIETDSSIEKRIYPSRLSQGQVFRITVKIERENLWIEEFDNIISSFNFLEPTISTDKLYKNIQYGFEITHPSTWRARDRSGGTNLRNHSNPSLDKPIDSIDLNISYLPDKNPEQQSIDDWIEEDFNIIYADNELSREIVDLGDEAIKIQHSKSSSFNNIPTNDSKTRYSYIIRRGVDIMTITYTLDNNTKYVHDPDSIISTLTFTDFDEDEYSNLVKEETQEIIGEDKNKNGIWDDIDDHINKTYPDSEKVRLALIQYASAFQKYIIDHRDNEKTGINRKNMARNNDCLVYIFDGDFTKAYKVLEELRIQTLNTKERIYAYFKADGQLTGSFKLNPESEYKSYCNFDPDALPN
jgi:hypothetical protein